MKHSSEILLVAALVAASFVIPSLQAGDSDPADRRAAFAAELGLSADQQASLDAIRTQERTALEALKADSNLSPDEKRAQLRSLREQFSGKRRQVLTADQQAKLKEKRGERGGDRKHPGGRKGGSKDGA
jgi:protein CpxP